MSQLQMLTAVVGLVLFVMFAAASLSTPMSLPFPAHLPADATVEPDASATLLLVMETPAAMRPATPLRKVLLFRLTRAGAANVLRQETTPTPVVAVKVTRQQESPPPPQDVSPTPGPTPGPTAFPTRYPNPHPTLVAVATLTAPPVQASALVVPGTSSLAPAPTALPAVRVLAMAGARKLQRRVPPGRNFDLSLWALQEPTGIGNSPTTILSDELETFQDAYFFTDRKDGAMDFWDPEDGVVSAHSKYPRSELREMTAQGTPANWPLTGTHTLSASLKVTRVPDRVCVGQIHIGTGTPASTTPLFELFYHADGSIVAALEQTPKGGDTITYAVGDVPLGQRWSYVIDVSDGAISLRVDGGDIQTWPVPPAFYQENFFFKAGDDGQSVGDNSTIGTLVSFYALDVAHEP